MDIELYDRDNRVNCISIMLVLEKKEKEIVGEYNIKYKKVI